MVKPEPWTKTTIKKSMNITTIIETVAEGMRPEDRNDLPAIRQALNDTIDAAVKGGQMTERQANNWDQARAVKRVQKLLR